MGFQTPLYELSEYLAWTNSGHIQLPDFQRDYKWEDERIRQLLITILRGHPLGVVMLLRSGSDQYRFKPKAIAGTKVAEGKEPALLLLDGQQRLTSLTQALSGDGVVETMDGRGKRLERQYFVEVSAALENGEDRLDEAVHSLPGDGVVRSDFGKKVDLDVSTTDKQHEHGYFPLRLLFQDEAFAWLMKLPDNAQAQAFMAKVVQPVRTYNIPAIELDTATSKAAVATVFEKVNTGGLPLNVFELLTATFAGDKGYFDTHGDDFRLNDDWGETVKLLAGESVLSGVESTDFLQATTLLATRKRNLAATDGKVPAVSARREDILKLTLDDYLEWRGPLREAFDWAANFLADRHIFIDKYLPYPKQLVPLAAIRVVMGDDAEMHGPQERIIRWFWSGILGELYGGAIETRFVRDVEQVPAWARGETDTPPRTVQDANFVESRLLSLRTRGAAAYKGIYALVLADGVHDWMKNKALDKQQHADLKVDIHHIFPKDWCGKNGIDDERRESIVNKTAIAYETNRSIGGAAPSVYLPKIEAKAGIDDAKLDELVTGHHIDAAALRADDFDAFFNKRRDQLCNLIETAIGKPVQRDIVDGDPEEMSSEFELVSVTELPDEED